MPKDDNPFRVLEGLRASLPSQPAPAPAGNAGKAAKPKKAAPARAVVRIERKGRGGKEATVVEKLTLADAELEAWLKEMKQSFGCGGTIEDGAIVLHGDQRDRVVFFLERAGIGKIIRG